MPRAATQPRRPALIGLAFGSLGSALLASVLAQRAPSQALMVALLPAALIAFAALVASDRSILVFGALALSMTAAPLQEPLPAPGGVQVHVADLLVLLALASYVVARVGGQEQAQRSGLQRTPVLGLAFVLFAIAIVTATVRGHELYGTSLVGEPIRLVLYAGIAAALSDLDPHKAYRGIVVVFYVGTVWMLLNAVYHMATGTSQTQQVHLSTGGTRVVSLSVAVYLGSALLLALLNLEIDQLARRRALHLAIAGLASFGVVLSFGRSTFAALGVAISLLALAFPRIRRAVLVLLPLCLPFIVLAAILLPRIAPDVGPTLIDRVTAAQTEDRNVRWREVANQAVFEQVRESPLTGSGFGRPTTFTFEGVRYRITQNPHNSFVWLLAGGGVFALGSFALLCLAFVRDAWRRLRSGIDGYERVLVLWPGFALLIVFANALTGPSFSVPAVLLTVWVLLLLPSVVPVRERTPATAPSR